MKTIQLTQGKRALVDDEDYELLMKFSWYYQYDPNNSCHTGYAKKER